MMTDKPYKPRLRYSLVGAACLWLAGCAGPLGLFNAEDTRPPFRDPAMSMQAARDVIIPGKSTNADVMAALGSATVIRFDSGFEVWVYRAKRAASATAGAEFVVLFTPSGIVKKTRIRPA